MINPARDSNLSQVNSKSGFKIIIIIIFIFKLIRINPTYNPGFVFISSILKNNQTLIVTFLFHYLRPFYIRRVTKQFSFLSCCGEMETENVEWGNRTSWDGIWKTLLNPFPSRLQVTTQTQCQLHFQAE